MAHTLSSMEIADLLGTDLATVNRKIIADTTFPRPLPSNYRAHGRPPRLFSHDEIIEWGRKYKAGLNIFLAQDAIRGKVWPVLKPQQFARGNNEQEKRLINRGGTKPLHAPPA